MMHFHKLFVVAIAGLIMIGLVGVAEAQVTSTFTPPDVEPPFTPSGNWTDPTDWDTPNYPDNGQPAPGDTYNAIVRAGTVFIGGDHTIEAFTLGELSDGSADGDLNDQSGTTPTLTVNGLFTWEAGSISGEVTVNAFGGISLDTPQIKRLNSSQSLGTGDFFVPVINHMGTGTWTGGSVGGQLVADDPDQLSTFNNLAGGTLAATAAGQTFLPRFNNMGVLNVDPGAGQTLTMENLFNDGTVNLLSGTFDLDPPIPQYNRQSTGDFVLQNGATLLLSAHIISETGSITGDGDVMFTGLGFGRRGEIGGQYTINGTTFIQGAAVLPDDATTTGLVLDGNGTLGVIGGGYTSGAQIAGSLTANGAAQWLNGGYHGTATLNAMGGMTFASTDDLHVLYDNITLNLYGDSVVNSGARGIAVEDDSELNIKPDATLTIHDGNFINSSADPGMLHNAGTLHNIGGYLGIGAQTVNTGLIIADGGDISFNGYGTDVPDEQQTGLMQQAGELRMLGAEITFIESFTGGRLTGFGGTNRLTITAGTLSPGMTEGPDDAVGMMTFDMLVLESGAVVEIDLAGTDPADHDRLVVDVESDISEFGDLQVGGDLVLRFAEGFEQSVTSTDTFTVIESIEALGGGFNNVAAGERLLTADGLASFIINYGPSSPFGDNAVVLSDFQEIPEPVGFGAMLLGGLTLLRRRRSRPVKR